MIQFFKKKLFGEIRKTGGYNPTIQIELMKIGQVLSHLIYKKGGEFINYQFKNLKNNSYGILYTI